MTRRFGQMLLIGCLFRLTRFCGLLSMARRLLRIARFLTLSATRRLIAISPSCRIACPEPVLSSAGGGAAPSLPVRLAWRARGFSGKIGGRNKAVHRNHRDLAFDQSLDVSEEL